MNARAQGRAPDVHAGRGASAGTRLAFRLVSESD
ncbi:hypothetical protein CKU38_02066 [Xanthomonas citri pv. fuscans]|nr:hypothetical protein CKU38_02066 [Xanthomonas citri pv. fuscans]